MSIDHIYDSLNQLNAAIDYLEQEMTRKDAERARQDAERAKQIQVKPAPAAKQAPQNDLFGDWTGNGRPANVNTAALLAKRLDNAIENVQWLLKEAEA